MQKKMKNEEFDHYIQSQFADEAIAPPQQIEGAIFEAMAKNSRRKKLGAIGTGILVLGALAYGVNGTMNTAHVVPKLLLLLCLCVPCVPVAVEVLDQEERPLQKQEVHDDVLPLLLLPVHPLSSRTQIQRRTPDPITSKRWQVVLFSLLSLTPRNCRRFCMKPIQKCG